MGFFSSHPVRILMVMGGQDARRYRSLPSRTPSPPVFVGRTEGRGAESMVDVHCTQHRGQRRVRGGGESRERAVVTTGGRVLSCRTVGEERGRVRGPEHARHAAHDALQLVGALHEGGAHSYV